MALHIISSMSVIYLPLVVRTCGKHVREAIFVCKYAGLFSSFMIHELVISIAHPEKGGGDQRLENISE